MLENHVLLVGQVTSDKWNHLLGNSNIPVKLHGKSLTFKKSNVKFHLEGDLLEVMTNKNFNKRNSPERKRMFEIKDEMRFDDCILIRGLGFKGVRCSLL